MGCEEGDKDRWDGHRDHGPDNIAVGDPTREVGSTVGNTPLWVVDDGVLQRSVKESGSIVGKRSTVRVRVDGLVESGEVEIGAEEVDKRCRSNE